MVNPTNDSGCDIDEEGERQPPPPPSAPAQTGLTQSKSGNYYFTFDDLPPHKYRDRLNDFGAWIDTRMTESGMTLPQVIAEFITRMIGNLREWMSGYSEYEKLQLINGSAAQFLGVLHQEFLGDITIIQKRNSQEYFEMRCCSLNRKDLETYYNKMAKKYYSL
ncbi:hypothetical protein PIB30_049745 [Stylosanthes scabra]|uniref:Polyprotein n=1 Tax=Stylosanthes scabra TaxID=79078 RepID=A0ABU6VIA1_9FABA|nr:hypothetical protein [Stylosanthes scabra]